MITEQCPACNYFRDEHTCCKCGIYAKPTMTTPTPETDNHARVYETAGMPAAYRVLLDLSRKLELQRDEANNTSRAMVRLQDEQEKEIEELCEERDQLRKVVDAVVNSTKCQTCNDTGWYSEMRWATSGDLEPEQVECRYCDHKNSRFKALILYSQLPHVKKENKSK